MITEKEEFELSNKCYALMTPVEQGMVLVLFKGKKRIPIIVAWIDSVHKVIKSTQEKR